MGGAWTAAWPLIRTDLGLSYVQVGILLSLPHVVGCIVELPIGLLGDAWDRRALVRAGGIGLAVSLLLVALSPGFAPLLLALVLLSPASGAFVCLAQAALMDTDPSRHEQNMARWALAGSIGVVSGPLVLIAVRTAGLGWRSVFVIFALLTALLVAAVWRARLGGAVVGRVETPVGVALRQAARDGLDALRRRAVLRWLVLLEFADLTLDVLLGYLALYFVDAMDASPAIGAFAILVWSGVGLIGDVLMIPLLERVQGLRYLRISAAVVMIVFPAFLLVDSLALKFALLGLLGILNAGWYSILQGRLYSALPGRSATVMTLRSLAGIAGGLLPFMVGLAAERFGIGASMWLLAAGPIVVLASLPRSRHVEPADR